MKAVRLDETIRYTNINSVIDLIICKVQVDPQMLSTMLQITICPRSGEEPKGEEEASTWGLGS